MGERKEAAVPGVAYEGGGSGDSGSSSCKRAAAVCKISKRSQQGIFKKMKPIAAYFATPPSNESQAHVHVHVPEPDANILSTEASDAKIVEDLVPEHEVYNEGSHDNTLQTSILGFSPTHIEPDPGLRKQIGDYPTPEIRDAVRREYLKKGPCQPYGHDFPRNTTDKRVFREESFDESDVFCSCGSLANLALKLVETKEHLHFPLVYRLITLALTLPVATASVERVFSAMNIIKTDLRNKISDDWLNDLMICYVERDIFAGIDDKKIIEHFHSLRDRRGHLPNPPRILMT
ncbi:unnamed protein product [Triticum turgidum subsp. durum]|uniref:HAT C-terminal dimerisation domain-containing protein n=1 Tax=Triticum turgidum subsp. durum TaxID=4567 RepID=A0A9R1PHI1_TRITD|nr:unnamed protein product [Triticum turgidum subsp. durum]